MSPSELTTALFERTGGTKAAAKKTIDALADIMTEQLQRGESVTFHSAIGHFSAKQKPERNGRNPKTGDAVVIKAHVSPVFKASKALKKALNQ